ASTAPGDGPAMRGAAEGVGIVPRQMRLLFCLALATVAVAVALSPAAGSPRAAAPAAAQSVSKCVTTDATYRGRSLLPTLRGLGVRVWQAGLIWPQVAPTRPKNPTNPRDRAYHWPKDLDVSIREAVHLGIEPVLYINGFTSWSNGGRDSRW